MNLHRRVAALDAARRRRQDAFVKGLTDADLLAVVEVEATVHSDVRWRGDEPVEAAYHDVEDVAAGVSWDRDLGPWQDAAVRRAARHLVEVVKAQGYEPWGEEHRRTGVR